MELTSKLTGTESVINRLRSKEQNITAAVFDAVKWGCVEVMNRAKETAPWDKGYLRANISYELPTPKLGEQIIGKIGVNDIVGYAKYVEYAIGKHARKTGTRIPFLRPSLTEKMFDINRKIVDAVNTGIKK